MLNEKLVSKQLAKSDIQNKFPPTGREALELAEGGVTYRKYPKGTLGKPTEVFINITPEHLVTRFFTDAQKNTYVVFEENNKLLDYIEGVDW